MNNKNIIIVIAVIALAGLALWFISQSIKAPDSYSNGNTNTNMQNNQNNDKRSSRNKNIQHFFRRFFKHLS